MPNFLSLFQAKFAENAFGTNSVGDICGVSERPIRFPVRLGDTAQPKSVTARSRGSAPTAPARPPRTDWSIARYAWHACPVPKAFSQSL